MTEKVKGIVLCAVVALPSYILGNIFPVVGGPVIAILVGIVIGKMITFDGSYKAGVTFTSKKVLQYAVILLGFGLNMKEVVRVGATSLPIIISTIATALIVAYLMSKALRIPKKTAILVGVGSSICGGSAIAATAPVIEARDDEIAEAISVIFFFNILAALLFPTLGQALGFTNEGFALFAGTAVNDTSSVTAAASSWDSIHGTAPMVLQGATIVKLTRTLAIIPITMVLAIIHAKQAEDDAKKGGKKLSIKKIFPMFIAYFLAASILTTICYALIDGGSITGSMATTIPQVFGFLKKLSKFFIVMAMGAIGLHTDIVKLVKTGGKPLIMGFCCWVAISGVSIGLQKLLGVF